MATCTPFDRPHPLMFRRVWTHRQAHWGSLAIMAAGWVAVGLWVDLSPKVETDFFFSADDPQLRASVELGNRFSSAPQVVVRAEDRADDRKLYLEHIQSLTEALGAIEGASSVLSITTDNPTRSPLFGRILLTPDERATNLIVQTDGSDPEQLLPRLESVLEEHDTPDFGLVMSGVPVIVEQIRRNLFRDLVVFSLAALLLYGLLAGIVYRDGAIVVGTLTTCLSACAATLLLTQALGIQIGLLTANLITIVFVLTLSHIVFLTANWSRVKARSLPDDDAVGRAVSLTAEASFWSMTTTLLGFLSLLVASAKPLRELGVAGAIGAATAMAVAYGLYPTFLRRIHSGRTEMAPPTSRPPSEGHAYSRPKLLGAIAMVAVFLGTGITKLDTDPGLLTYFAEGSPLRDGLEQIDLDGGSSTLNIAVRDAAGGRVDQDVVNERMWAFQDALEDDSAVGVVLSPPVLLGHAQTQPLARFMSLSTLLDIAASPAFGGVARGFVSIDRDEGLFSLRMRESVEEGSRESVIARLTDYARNAGLEPVLVAGLYDLQAQLGRLIASSLRIGLAGLLVLFIGVALFVARSARHAAIMVACLAVIPLVVLGTFGHLGIAVDIITSPAANVALALGVDSMIHLVVRVRHLGAEGLTPTESWATARHQILRPVLSATLLICVGFGIFTLSTFPPTQRFGFAVILGTMTAATVALVALPTAAALLPGKAGSKL